MDTRLSQQCALAKIKANGSAALQECSQQTDGSNYSCLLFGRMELENCAQFWTPEDKMDISKLEGIYQMAAEVTGRL